MPGMTESEIGVSQGNCGGVTKYLFGSGQLKKMKLILK